jgi:hypothetical protein
MRQVFRSPRLENVEGVKALLEEHGIATYLSGGRSYKGNRRDRFSYSDRAREEPALWIVHAEDLPRSRQLLRDAGLMEPSWRSEITGGGGGAASAASDPAPTPAQRATRTASRLRTVLLVALAGACLLTVWRLVAGPAA